MLILRHGRDHWRWWVLAGALALGAVTGWAGLATGIERTLQEGAWRLRPQPASGDLHIVEIDARSLSAIDRWPWPRSNHARVVDRLQQAGAASIAFDVDFSSRSSAPEDAALAAALDRADGKVVLPTFRQPAGGGRAGWTDSLPMAPLREHSLAAAVSILPDEDGYVRRAPVGTITAGVPRPSLSAMIAGQAGAAGRDFPIDFGIDPSSIPRHSFIDIREGNFKPSEVAGKHFLIGATAVEMGDRYVVPVHGVLPGVVVQALAAETLMRGVPRETGWPLGLVAAVVLAWWIVRMRSRKGLAIATLTAPLGILILAELARTALNWRFEIAPALAVLVAASAGSAAMRLLAAAHRRRLHDAETGLPNRFALEEALRGSGEAGLIAARIAEFDKIVAGLGAAGTVELILRVRDRIALLDQGATIYRVEDRVLGWRCDDENDLEQYAATLRTLMLNPVEVRGRRIDVALALGYAKGDAQDPARIAAHAALAADKAQPSAASCNVHRSSDDAEIERELSLLGELDEALGSDEIQVLYQPKIEIGTGRIVSVEALVRWHHATRGFLRPDQFIPLAEQNGRIGGLTLDVVKRTVSDLRVWHAAGHTIGAAINVSAKLLHSGDFIGKFRNLIEASRIDAKWLTIEVTESATMEDPDTAIAALRTFQELGIAISIDDYGTGQSTLSYLKRLPLSELKIDQSFIKHVHQNRSDAILVRSTVELAHELGLKVVAEGVEDQECLAYLQSIGCDLAQGYLISRPIDVRRILDLLNSETANAAPAYRRAS